MIDLLIRRNRWVPVAGLTEAGNSLYLLQARLLPNLYPAWNSFEIDDLMRVRPAVLFPVFTFFVIGWLLTSKDALRNRLSVSG
jgi:hypothetical protein